MSENLKSQQQNLKDKL